MRNKFKRNYRIIITSRGKKLYHIGYYENVSDAMKEFNELIKRNEKIVFPKRLIKVRSVHYPADYELYILENKKLHGQETIELRNEYGEFVEHTTNSKKWNIYDKHQWLVEEEFFVYGFNPQYEKKNFNWVYENLIANDAKNKYAFKNIHLLKNKIIIDTAGKLDMVLARDKSDAIRLYNMLEERAQKDKLKYIMFSGDIRQGKQLKEWYKRLMDWTGWNKTKISRHSLRP